LQLSVIDPIIDRRNKESTMGLGEHLEDLRRRLIYMVLGLLPLAGVALYFASNLVDIILAPLRHALAHEGLSEQVQATGPLETFGGWFKVALVAACVAGAPWIIYQLWKFIAPGLYSHEKRFAYVLAPLSVVLTIVGMLVMYYIMLPMGLRWLVNFGTTLVPATVAVAPLPEGMLLPTPLPILAADPPNPVVGQMWINTQLHAIRVALPVPSELPAKSVVDLVANITGTNPAGGGIEVRSMPLTRPGVISQQYRFKEYLDLFFGLTIAVSLAFQLPVVILLLGWAGIVTPQWLSKYRRHAVVGAMILGVIINPAPDPVSMLMMVVPLYLLFELGIVLLRILPASRLAGDKPDMAGDGGGP